MRDSGRSSLVERISLWIREQVDAAGADGVVLGLSGGIDSAVVAALAQRAVGPKALGVLLPCYSNVQSEKDAHLVARKYSIETATVDLCSVNDELLRLLPPGDGMAVANIRPRLRMTVLYYYGNLWNRLVVGTSNRTEIMVGYFTKAGDGAADIEPIGSLYKSQVRQLAVELDMPREILDKPPTADLWDGQTDEQELGLTYDELDAILMGMDSGDVGRFGPRRVQRVKDLIARSEHKRRPVPVYRDDQESHCSEY